MRNLHAQLDESLRDAYVSYYLGQLVPNTPALSAVKTEADLYEYLLIDPRVATDVTTSRVAQAIASVQQYINAVMLNMEPGRASLPADDVADWAQSGSQYSIWAGDQELQDYPENYIDPTLRERKTGLFGLLENQLAAHALNDTSIQQSFLAYLTGFETISNLKVLNGYAESPDSGNAVYYLTGQSNIVPNQFYWRSLDMSARDSSGALNPTAWTEWNAIELAQSADIEIIRPFVFGGRLHLVWLQRGELPQTGPETDTTEYSEYKLCCAYRGFDGNWSVPHTLRSWSSPDGTTDASAYDYELIAVIDQRPDKYKAGTTPDYTYYNDEDIIYISLVATQTADASKVTYLNAPCDLLFTPLGEPAVPSSDYDSFGQYLHMTLYSSDSTLQSTFSKQTATTTTATGASGSSTHQADMALNIISSTLSADGSQITYVLEGTDSYTSAATGKGTLQLTSADGSVTICSASVALNDSGSASTGQGSCTVAYSAGATTTVQLSYTASTSSEEMADDAAVNFKITTAESYPDTSNIPILKTNAGNNAQYLDFTGSDDTGVNTLRIRLNTQIGKDLIARASASVASVLSWDTQNLTEPPLLSTDAPAPIDFNGANGLYFWELFFHAPHLVAYRLNQEQQYAKAALWIHYLFDPSARRSDGSSPPPYWNSRPLVEAGNASYEAAGPTDPDAIAYSNPVHYQKTLFQLYVRNLIAAGDAFYRTQTPDSLSMAKLIYRQALDLLGPFPGGELENDWAPVTLGSAVSAGNPALRDFERTQAGPTPVPQATPAPHPLLGALDLPSRPPLNSQLLGYWSTLDSRLYNLRHNLSLTGQPMSVPLYATPADPARLMAARGAGATPLQVLGYAAAPTIPAYRFQALLPSAYRAVATLNRFGDLLLSYQERKDRASQEEMQQEQLLALSAFTVSLQQLSLQAANDTLDVLNANLSSATDRQTHFQQLASNGNSTQETAAMGLQGTGLILGTSSIPFLAAGAALAMMPNIRGTAWGGAMKQAPLLATGTILQTLAISLNGSAAIIAESEAYDRRNKEWQFQADQAQDEIDTLHLQVTVQNVLVTAAQTSLDQANAQQQQILDMKNFLQTRDSSGSLYQWLVGQMSALYSSAYQAVQALCLGTQASWQYEMGDYKTTFVNPNAWDDSHKGLTAGDTLTFNLQQMENAYLQRNERRLEIVKTVALSTLLGSDWKGSIVTPTDGTDTSYIDFSINEALLDSDYPGHYLRQLKSVSLTLPATVGPYQDVRATLAQSSSSVLLTADIAGVNYLLDPDGSGASPANVITNLRPSQQIVLSTGLNDAGQFVLDMYDQRYLPFEGTGAVSGWRLTFPHASGTDQASLLGSLTDIIVQLRYTARDGGPAFAKAVIAAQTAPAASGKATKTASRATRH
ncbi:Tc toxin subunit A-related protein [Microvirgula aerodenitrificans]|uniref:Tc toxin subunit A-related protein n=1 Tax=Microvirgula aerodenitrificans TaxID=57480 RepID=UPI00048B2DD1|nr:neuraminidase-like domain-containing protein [Microvirgula aerodenitrificans]